MSKLWTVLLCTVLTALPLQGQTMFRFGPVLGFQTYSFGAVLPVGNELSVLPVEGLGLDVGLAASAHVSLSSALSLRFDASAAYSTASIQSDFPVVVVVDGEAVDGLIQRTHDIMSRRWYAGTGLDVRVFERTTLSTLVGVGIPQTISISASDEFVSPPSATFISSGTSSRSLEGGWPEGGPVQPYMLVGGEVSHRFTLGSFATLLAFVRAQFGVTTALETAPWNPSQLSIGILAEIPNTAPPPVTQDEQVTVLPEPTINIVKLVPHEFRDTVVEVVPFSVTDTAVRFDVDSTTDTYTRIGPNGDTLHVNKRFVVKKFIPEPPPFLSSVLDVEVVPGSVDSLTMINVRLTTVSDTTVRTNVVCLVDNEHVWNVKSDHENDEWNVSLREIVTDLEARDEVTIVFRATVADGIGQVFKLPEQVVVFRRTRGSQLEAISSD